MHGKTAIFAEDILPYVERLVQRFGRSSSRNALVARDAAVPGDLVAGFELFADHAVSALACDALDYADVLVPRTSGD